MLHVELWSRMCFLHVVCTEERVTYVCMCMRGYVCLQSCVVKTQLLDQLLTPEQLVSAVTSWQDARADAQIEMAAVWLPSHDSSAAANGDPTGSRDGSTAAAAAAMDVDPPAAASQPPAGSRGSRKRRSDQAAAALASQQPAAAAAAATQPALPPTRAYVDVCGVQLPRRRGASRAHSHAAATSESSSHTRLLHKSQSGEHVFVETPTVVKNMRAAAWALCCARPLLLEGPPGSGKTALLEEMARRTGNAAGMVRHSLRHNTLRMLCWLRDCNAVGYNSC